MSWDVPPFQCCGQVWGLVSSLNFGRTHLLCAGFSLSEGFYGWCTGSWLQVYPEPLSPHNLGSQLSASRELIHVTLLSQCVSVRACTAPHNRPCAVESGLCNGPHSASEPSFLIGLFADLLKEPAFGSKLFSTIFPFSIFNTVHSVCIFSYLILSPCWSCFLPPLASSWFLKL